MKDLIEILGNTLAQLSAGHILALLLVVCLLVFALAVLLVIIFRNAISNRIAPAVKDSRSSSVVDYLSELRPGDRVTIVSGTEVVRDGKVFSWLPHHRKYVGKIAHLAEVTYRQNGFCFCRLEIDREEALWPAEWLKRL